MQYETLKGIFKDICPQVDFCSLRIHKEAHQRVHLRRGVFEPSPMIDDRGAMITVYHKGGMGYAATSELTREGLCKARDEALSLSEANSRHSVHDYSTINWKHPRGEYQSKVKKPWDSMAFTDKIDFLKRISEKLKSGEEIVDWHAELWAIDDERLYLTNEGGEVFQKFHFLLPELAVTAADQNDAVHRSLGGYNYGRQGGLEILDDIDYQNAPQWIPDEALTLLKAPNCPSRKMDLMLDPGQLMLQIHESIGHPLELDRILGDERNYAGTSFVTLDMFGKYHYGSPLLNVTYNPDVDQQICSYHFDDDGGEAQKEYIIKEGVLMRPLGGEISQQRAGISEGVANSRAESWRRPAIDRMANLNIEPGKSSVKEMIGSIEDGIFMKTNTSWSIDDSRNKFQFGCQWAQLIKNGELTEVVKKPNYRGRSADFWRNLIMVGNKDSFDVMGTPYCGKGEPNQAVRVGHAAPVCVFTGIDVFGGE